jgi:predicted nucleic acid-binding protein
MRTARDALRRLHSRGHELCVTPQNVIEFWSVCTRPLRMNGLGNSVEAADRLTTRIVSVFTLRPDSPDVFRRWRELVVVHQVSGSKVHDTRLVASMLVHRVEAILTFNTADFTRFSEITVLDPGQVNASPDG